MTAHVGLGDTPDTMPTLERLHRLLTTKHSAYISSSSPLFHKHGKPETGQLLASDERLQCEWANVLRQREDFCKDMPPACVKCRQATSALSILFEIMRV